MKIHQLRALVAVSDAGSIQAAADRLHLSQPALSKAVRELERELGVPLLIRSSRGTAVSRYGEALLPRFKAIGLELDNIRQEAAWLQEKWSGRLRLAIVPLAGDRTLARALAAFRTRLPSVQIAVTELRSSGVASAVRNSDVDLGLVARPGRPEETELTLEPLYDVQTIVTASGAYATDGEAVRTLASLADRDWLSLDPTGDTESYLRDLFRANGSPSPRNVLQCTSPVLGYELALDTSLMCYWTKSGFEMAQRLHGPGGMTETRLDTPLPQLSVSLLYQDEALLTRSARTFIALLRRELESKRA